VNKYIVTLAASFLLTACQQEASEETKIDQPNKTEVAATSAEVKAETKGEVQDNSGIAEKDKIAYAIGTNMANSILGITTEYKALTMDVEVVKQGFSDALKNESKLTEEQISQQMQIFQQKMRYAQQQKHQAESAKKAAEAETYLAENLTKGFTKTESGLQYKVITAAADGAAKPLATDKVKVHYHGTFTDGKVFDSSVERDEPSSFGLNQVISGWTEGLQLMGVGSKFHFVIPPQLGYGMNDSRGIPGGSVLNFEVELLEIIQPPKTTESAK